jgi:hypothetical protein
MAVSVLPALAVVRASSQDEFAGVCRSRLPGFWYVEIAIPAVFVDLLYDA